MSRSSGLPFSDFIMSFPFVYTIYMGYSKLISVQTGYFTIISLGILIYFIYRQSKEVKNFTLKRTLEIFHAKDISKLTKVIYFCFIGAGLLVFLFFTILFTSAWFGAAWPDEYFGTSKDITSLPDLIIGLLMAIFGGLLVSFFLVYSFFFGTILSGTTIAITINNFLSGKGFEVETFITSIFDISLPEPISYALVIVQLIVSPILNFSNTTINYPTP